MIRKVFDFAIIIFIHLSLNKKLLKRRYIIYIIRKDK